MPERCTWCDKFPLLRVEVALVEADTTHYVCRECWPTEKWGKFPPDRDRDARAKHTGIEQQEARDDD